MEIRFGAPLVTAGGAHVGAIQRVVLQSETQRLRAVTVRVGHVFARERVIGAPFLGLDGRRLTTSLEAADVARLPQLSDAHMVEDSGSRDRVLPYATWSSGEMSNTSFVGGSAAVNRRVMPTFDVPEADTDVTLVDSHTTVHGFDGSKIGTVCAVVCDASGTAIGLMIKRPGLFRSREIYVPTDLASYSGPSAGVLGIEWRE